MNFLARLIIWSVLVSIFFPLPFFLVRYHFLTVEVIQDMFRA